MSAVSGTVIPVNGATVKGDLTATKQIHTEKSQAGGRRSMQQLGGEARGSKYLCTKIFR
jgi:hypothetical protein